MSNKVIIIEDDDSIRSLLELHLRQNSFQVDSSADGKEGLEKLLAGDYQLLIVDLMLPGMDGKEIIKAVRPKLPNLPILITTVKADLMNKVVGFEIGADDYLAKPFEIEELLARVRALLRRTQPQKHEVANQIYKVGDISIDECRHKVYLEGKEISLTPILFDLLLFLIKSPGRAYSRNDLLMHVWGYDSEGYEHTVDTHINRLRAKIEPKPAAPKYILTVWGVGYRFVEDKELK